MVRNSNKNKKVKKAKKELLNGRVIEKEYKNFDHYFGGFKNNKRHGWGMMTIPFSRKKSDDYNMWKNYDNATLYPYSWVIYSGNWKYGEPHGEGKLIFPNDSYCKGIWKNGYIEYGEYCYNNGQVYIGDFAKMYFRDLFHITALKHGNGILFDETGDKIYDGEWMSIPSIFSMKSLMSSSPPISFQHGTGKYYVKIEGKWKNGHFD